jgi:hypothetical protein
MVRSTPFTVAAAIAASECLPWIAFDLVAQPRAGFAQVGADLNNLRVLWAKFLGLAGHLTLQPQHFRTQQLDRWRAHQVEQLLVGTAGAHAFELRDLRLKGQMPRARRDQIGHLLRQLLAAARRPPT